MEVEAFSGLLLEGELSHKPRRAENAENAFGHGSNPCHSAHILCSPNGQQPAIRQAKEHGRMPTHKTWVFPSVNLNPNSGFPLPFQTSLERAASSKDPSLFSPLSFSGIQVPHLELWRQRPLDRLVFLCSKKRVVLVFACLERGVG